MMTMTKMTKNHTFWEEYEDETFWQAFSGDALQSNQNIRVGDTIEKITSNQLGYQKYKVVLDRKTKIKKIIAIDG